MVSKREMAASVVGAFCLATALFSSVWIAGSAGDWDPWMDVDENGIVNMLDLYYVAQKYGTSGIPITKEAVEYDSGWINITDKCGQYFNITHNLNSTDIMVDITGKTTLDGGAHQKNLGGTGYTPGWSSTYGGTGYEYAYSVIQTGDGGYAIAGLTYSYGAGSADSWLVKTDLDGDVQWSRTYGGGYYDEAYSVIQTSDDGYAIAGSTMSFGAGSYDFWLVKTDTNGNHLWNKTYGGTTIDRAYALVETSDGGYVIAGNTYSYGSGQSDFWLVKTNAAGSVLWSRTYGGTSNDCVFSLVNTTDGGYAMAGSTSSYGAGNDDFWLIKTDSNGIAQWNKTYGGASIDDSDGALSVIQTGDQGYAIAGYTTYGAGAYDDFWLVKTDASGNAQWNKTYHGGGYDEAYSLVQTGDGGYAIAGWTNSYPAGEDDDLRLVKTDAYGNAQWNKTYGGTEHDEAYSLIQTSDGGYAIVGSTSSYGAGSRDFWFVKTEAESGLMWTDSAADTVTLYRGATDLYWNFVRVLIWEPKTSP